MKFYRNAILLVFLTAFLLQSVISLETETSKIINLTRKTRAQDWGGGNIYYLDRQYVGCPAKTAIEGFRLYRPSGNTLAYQYSCRTRCSGLKAGKTYVRTTKPNATAGNKQQSANYLDRHHLSCKNGYAMQDFKMQRSGGSNIYYRYKCTQALCKKRATKYTSWQSGGRNEVIYLDRQHVRMEFHDVITGFKLETHYRGGTHMRYRIDYCTLKHPPKKGKKKSSKRKSSKRKSRKPKRKPSRKPRAPKRPAPRKPRVPRPVGRPAPRRPSPPRPAPMRPIRPKKPMITGGGGRGIPPPRPRPVRPTPIRPSGGPGSLPPIKPQPMPISGGGGRGLPPMPAQPLPSPGAGGAGAAGAGGAGFSGSVTAAGLNPAQLAALQKGKIFCATNCVRNEAANVIRCLDDNSKIIPCRRCTIKPGKVDKDTKDTCELVCNAPTYLNPPCDFYGYLNNAKKQHSRRLLAKFGLVILRKMFR